MEVFLQDLGVNPIFLDHKGRGILREGRDCPIIKHCSRLQHLQIKKILPSARADLEVKVLVLPKSPGNCQRAVQEGFYSSLFANRALTEAIPAEPEPELSKAGLN